MLKWCGTAAFLTPASLATVAIERGLRRIIRENEPQAKDKNTLARAVVFLDSGLVEVSKEGVFWRCR